MENKEKIKIEPGEKYNVLKGIVDLKPTQIELLKVLKKLDNNLDSNDYPKKREELEKMYSEIFDELKLIVDFIKKLKENKLMEVDDKFLKNADVITKMLNGKTDEIYEFKIPKNIPVVDSIKLKPMVFDDSFLNDDIIKKGKTDISGTHQNTLTINLDNSKIIDGSIITSSNELIARNNSNTFTVRFKDIDISDSLVPDTKSLFAKNHQNTLTIDLPSGTIGPDIISKGRKSIESNHENTLTIKFDSTQKGDSTAFLKSVRDNIERNNAIDLSSPLPETPASDSRIIEQGRKIISEAKVVDSPTFARETLFDVDMSPFRKQIGEKMKEATNYITSKKELLTEQTEDLSEYGQKMEEIDEATFIVKSLIDILTNVLRVDKIRMLVSKEVKIKHKSEFIFDKSKFKVDSRGATLDLPEIVKIFDIEQAKIKGIDITLDNDPVLSGGSVTLSHKLNSKNSGNLILSGGNLDAFRRKLFEPKKDKPSLIKQIKLNIEELKNEINHFNVLFIQYNYFINFLVNKMRQLQTLEEHDIFVALNMQQVKNYLDILERKYKIITNPQDIFKSDINTPAKTKEKVLYFKHYYFIHILFHLLSEVNTLAKSAGFENNPEYSITLLNEDLSTEESTVEISKYFMIFNLYSDLIKD